MDGKKRWGVSVAALIRRSRDVGVLTEGQYKSAFVRLSQMGWRKREPAPRNAPRPHERPSMIFEALDLAAEHGLTLDRLGERLGYGGGMLRTLLGEVPLDPTPRLRECSSPTSATTVIDFAARDTASAGARPPAPSGGPRVVNLAAFRSSAD